MLPRVITEKFTNGNVEQALDALRHYLEEHQDQLNAEAYHQASVLEEQYGEWKLAGLAHKSCINTAGNNPIALLYAGHWLQKSEFDEAAAAAYSLCQDINSSFIGLNQASQQAQPTVMRSQDANLHLRYFLTNHHKSCVSEPNIADAVWTRTNDTKPTLPENYLPSLFWIQHLKQQAYYPSSVFSWAHELLSMTTIIKQELTNFVNNTSNKNFIRPYLEGTPSNYENLGNLVNSRDWTAIDLFKNGQCPTQLAAAFPKTYEALKNVPCYQLDDNPFEVFFSILKAGQVIDPHYGQSNHSLTVHLPIEVPGEGFLEVDGKNEYWQEGELLIFDDNFLHSATNKSDKDRIVLIFSIWHPDLSTDECHAVKTAFKARGEWLTKRWNTVSQAFDSV